MTTGTQKKLIDYFLFSRKLDEWQYSLKKTSWKELRDNGVNQSTGQLTAILGFESLLVGEKKMKEVRNSTVLNPGEKK